MPKSRKKQARLGFTPLPSSSPASKGYNKQIRDRAANVSLEGRPSPAKRRRVQDEEEVQMISSDEDEAATMPTPATSLEKPKANDEDQAEEDSDDLPIRSSQRRPTGKLPSRKSRAKQQRLDFTSARDPDSFDTPIKLTSSSSKPPKSSKAGIFSSQANGKVLDISSDESESDSNGLPSPRKLMTRSRKAAKEKEKEEEQRGVGRPKSLDAQDDDSDEITVSTTRPQPEQMQEESEDEDDEMPTTLGTQRRQRRRVPSRDSFISDSPPPPADSDDDLEIIERPSRKRRTEASGSEEEQEEENEDVEPQTPSRRRLKKQPRQMSKQEQDDLAEDLDFLGPSSDAENSGRRSSQSKQKNARQQALDRLKQKRSGKLPQVEEEEEQEEGEDGNDEEAVQEISDDEVQEVPQYTSSRQFFKEDDEDADFLVDGEDEEETLGIPDGIPIEFTRYASMKGKELFKFAVDWMVQYKINPSFKKDDPLYKLTFQKLGHEVYGLAGSKYISSAWTPGFTVALQSRPVIAWQRIDRSSAEHYMRDKCDACNRSGHPAKYEIQFQGLPYDPETLEELQQDDDSSSDEDDDFSSAEGDKHDDDAPDWDLSGREVVPISTVFYVGKFCKANAETAHALQHWKITLKSLVDEWLSKAGLMTAAELEKREGWKTKKKRKYANKIVDRMEKDGEIKELWGHWKRNIEEARDAKTGRFEPESP